MTRKSPPGSPRRAAIAAPEREGWLTEVPGRNWGKLYVAKKLMALLEKPDADLRAPQFV